MRRIDLALLPFTMDLVLAMSQLMMNFRALDLGASPLMVGALLGLGWCLPYTACCLATGRTIARYGARKLMVVGTLVFAVGAALYALAYAPWVLLAAAPLGGVGAALFWPGLQTYLHSHDPAETRRRTGTFNVSWTIGILCGTGLAGHAYDALGPHWCFLVIAAVAGLTAAAIAVRLDDPEPMTAAGPEAPAAQGAPRWVLKRNLAIAWVANFAAWFVGSLAVTTFPRLARSVGLADGVTGEVAALAWVGQVAVFTALTVRGGRGYRVWPLAAALCGTAAGAALLGLGRSLPPFALAFLLLGASRSPAHMAGIRYGLEDTASRNANMGYHEAIIGGGSVLGPLAAGLAASGLGLRAPYWLAAGVAAAAIVAVWTIHAAAGRRARAALSQAA